MRQSRALALRRRLHASAHPWSMGARTRRSSPHTVPSFPRSRPGCTCRCHPCPVCVCMPRLCARAICAWGAASVCTLSNHMRAFLAASGSSMPRERPVQYTRVSMRTQAGSPRSTRTCAVCRVACRALTLPSRTSSSVQGSNSSTSYPCACGNKYTHVRTLWRAAREAAAQKGTTVAYLDIAVARVRS